MLEHLAVVDTDGTASLRRVDVVQQVGRGALVVVVGQATGEERRRRPAAASGSG